MLYPSVLLFLYHCISYIAFFCIPSRGNNIILLLLDGGNKSGVFGQVFVCAAGMLAVPIRLQYRAININNT